MTSGAATLGSAGARKGAALPLVLRPRAKALGGALVLGLMIHGVVVLWGALARPRVAPLPQANLSFAEVELVALPPEPEIAEPAPGGGSERAGREPEAEGNSEPPPKPTPASVAPPPTPKPAETPAPPPSDGKVETREHGNADVDVPDDLFALDAQLTDSEEADPFSIALKPKPAWRNESAQAARHMAGKRARFTAHYGTGPGSKGGAGGGRRGGRGATGGGSTVFGGRSGAFVGNVCFIPERTRSIRSLGACRTQALIYTDYFDVPTTPFEKGFPGVADRIEWFSILYRGSFEVSQTGEYEFALASDDGSILRINGRVIVDNDGLHGPVVKRGTVRLTQGTHELDLRYFQGPRTLVSLQLWVTPPGG
jgi:hypothetical protein